MSRYSRTRLRIYACDGCSVYCDKTQMEVSGKQIGAMADKRNDNKNHLQPEKISLQTYVRSSNERD